MPNNEVINSVVGSVAYDEVDKLLAKLTMLGDKVVDINNIGKTATIDLKGATGIAEVNSGLESLALNTKNGIAASRELEISYKQFNTTLQANAKATKELELANKAAAQADKESAAAALLGAKAATESEQAKLAAARAATEGAKATLNEAKAATENQKQRNLEAKYIAALTAEKQKLEAQLVKEEAALIKNQSAYAQLSDQYRIAAKEAQNLGAQYFFLEQEIKNLSALPPAPGVTTEIDAKKAQLEQLAITMKEAQANALGLSKSLLAIDQTVGKSQRNVGAYQGAVFALSQVIREAPSFAYSFATGLLGISNNIPILVDEIKKLIAANVALQAEGKPTVNIFKTLATSLLSPVNLITIAIGLWTIWSARMAMAKNATDGAIDANKKYADSIKSIDENARTSAYGEIARVKVLTDIAKDQTQSMANRNRAIDELQKKFPDYFGNLTKEAILNGEVTKSVNDVSDALIARSLATAAEKKIAESGERIYALTESQKTATNDLAAAQGRYNDAVQRGARGTDEGAGLAVLAFADKVKAEKEALEGVNKQLAQARAEQQRYVDDATKFGKQAGQTLFSPDPKAPREKKPHDTTNSDLRDAQDVTKELYAEVSKQIDIEAGGYKAIADDESKSFDDRIAAYKAYSDLHFQSQAENISAEYDETQQALDKIAIIEGKSVDKRTQQEKDLVAKKAVLLQQQETLVEQYNLLQVNSENEKNKAVQGLQDKEVQYLLNGVNQIKDANQIAMDAALKAEGDRYHNGEESYKQYQANLKKIRDDYAVKEQQDILAYLQKELESLQAQGVDVKKILDAISAYRAKLSDADLDKQKTKDKELADAQKAAVAEGIQLAGQYTDVLQGFADDMAQKQIDEHEVELKNLQSKYQFEIEAVNASMLTQEQKSAQIQKLNAQQALQEKQIQAEENQIKRKQAQADKTASIAKIIEGTASAIMGVIGIPFYGEALAAVIAVLGAAQIARVIAAPVPQYATGVKSSPETLAIVGERGPEGRINPDGSMELTPGVPTLTYLQAGTQIIPHNELAAMAQSATMSKLAGSGKPVNDKSYAKELIRSWERNSNKIVNAIEGKRLVVESYHNGDYAYKAKHQ